MTPYKFAIQAAQDIDDIYSYIADRNAAAADRLTTRFTNQFARLAETPGMGRGRDELRPDLHNIADENYVIFYRFDRSAVVVVRVLRGGRQGYTGRVSADDRRRPSHPLK